MKNFTLWMKIVAFVPLFLLTNDAFAVYKSINTAKEENLNDLQKSSSKDLFIYDVPYQKKWANVRVDVYINNTKVTSLQSAKCIRLKIKPGIYQFDFKPIQDVDNKSKFPPRSAFVEVVADQDSFFVQNQLSSLAGKTYNKLYFQYGSFGTQHYQKHKPEVLVVDYKRLEGIEPVGSETIIDVLSKAYEQTPEERPFAFFYNQFSDLYNISQRVTALHNPNQSILVETTKEGENYTVSEYNKIMRKDETVFDLTKYTEIKSISTDTIQKENKILETVKSEIFIKSTEGSGLNFELKEYKLDFYSRLISEANPTLIESETYIKTIVGDSIAFVFMPTDDALLGLGINNRREKIKFDLYLQKSRGAKPSSSLSTLNDRSSESLRETKLSNSDLGIDENLKYRRSSLYTLMTLDSTRMHEGVVINAFGNSELSDNFDEHNIGPYLIETDAKIKDQTQIITNYLNNQGVAKRLVAKWFNRKKDGSFDMELVAERGMYDATAFDVAIASKNVRGNAVLADAGEELIGKTFVVVHDLNFTNKEEVAKRASGILQALGDIAEIAGVDGASDIGALAGGATEMVGKGFVVKTRTYLFQLVWDEQIASTFYEKFWIDQNHPDQSKKNAFDNSDIFKLKYIGSEVAWADVQSTIFTNKSDEELIEKATNKAIDKAIANLQREFEVFRVKTPILNTEPLTAKIGLKEGLEKGDRFEVLEQVLNKDGQTIYERKGIVAVDKNRIWDNRFEATEENPHANSDPYTYFKGKGSYCPGMLIRQIN